MCSQACKQQGFVHNSKQERLVAEAVLAAESIADADVVLPMPPSQPNAFVRSQTDRNEMYTVTQGATEHAVCSCPVGQMHAPCKHAMKVISMQTGARGVDIVYYLGTWAGTERGGFQFLQNAAPDDRHANLLEDEEDEEAESLISMECNSDDDNAAAGDDQPLPAVSIASIESAAAHLLSMAKQGPEMCAHVAAAVQQAVGTVDRIAARMTLGISHSQPVLTAVPDNGLGNSLKRAKPFIESNVSSRRRPPATDATAEPFTKVITKAKNQTFKDQLGGGRDDNTAAALGAPYPSQQQSQPLQQLSLNIPRLTNIPISAQLQAPPTHSQASCDSLIFQAMHHFRN
jgi:SWIM zinc finger